MALRRSRYLPFKLGWNTDETDETRICTDFCMLPQKICENPCLIRVIRVPP